MSGWLEDKDGNRASIAFFGTKKKAQQALDSLVNCKNCKNCLDYSYCWNCFVGQDSAEGINAKAT